MSFIQYRSSSDFKQAFNDLNQYGQIGHEEIEFDCLRPYTTKKPTGIIARIIRFIQNFCFNRKQKVALKTVEFFRINQHHAIGKSKEIETFGNKLISEIGAKYRKPAEYALQSLLATLEIFEQKFEGVNSLEQNRQKFEDEAAVRIKAAEDREAQLINEERTKKEEFADQERRIEVAAAKILIEAREESRKILAEAEAAKVKELEEVRDAKRKQEKTVEESEARLKIEKEKLEAIEKTKQTELQELQKQAETQIQQLEKQAGEKRGQILSEAETYKQRKELEALDAVAALKKQKQEELEKFNNEKNGEIQAAKTQAEASIQKYKKLEKEEIERSHSAIMKLAKKAFDSGLDIILACRDGTEYACSSLLKKYIPFFGTFITFDSTLSSIDKSTKDFAQKFPDLFKKEQEMWLKRQPFDEKEPLEEKEPADLHPPQKTDAVAGQIPGIGLGLEAGPEVQEQVPLEETLPIVHLDEMGDFSHIAVRNLLDFVDSVDRLKEDLKNVVTKSQREIDDFLKLIDSLINKIDQDEMIREKLQLEPTCLIAMKNELLEIKQKLIWGLERIDSAPLSKEPAPEVEPKKDAAEKAGVKVKKQDEKEADKAVKKDGDKVVNKAPEKPAPIKEDHFPPDQSYMKSSW